MSLRPVLYAIDQQNVAGCGGTIVRQGGDVGRHTGDVVAVGARAGLCRLANAACAATGATPRYWSATAPGWLPWFADIDRQMYFFYAATMAPFLVMAIALILGDILYKPGQSAERRTLGLIAVSCYVALVVTNFAWLFPVLTGLPISQTDLEHGDLAAQLALVSPVPRDSSHGWRCASIHDHGFWLTSVTATSIIARMGMTDRRQ